MHGKLVRAATAAAGLLVIGIAAPANAAPETDTVTMHDVTETFLDVYPSCSEDAPAYLVTVTYNSVDHSTVSGDTAHFTFTQTGTFTATPAEDATLPDVSGHFTVWGGFNQNAGGVSNGTFTFNITGTNDDGTPLRVHAVDHFNTTPTGAEFFFTHCHD